MDPLAGACVPLLGPGQPVTALLRADTPDPRGAVRAAVLLLNGDTAQAHAVDPAAVLPGVRLRPDGSYVVGAWEPISPGLDPLASD